MSPSAGVEADRETATPHVAATTRPHRKAIDRLLGNMPGTFFYFFFIKTCASSAHVES